METGQTRDHGIVQPSGFLVLAQTIHIGLAVLETQGVRGE